MTVVTDLAAEKKVFKTQFETVFGKSDDYHPRLNTVELDVNKNTCGVIYTQVGFIRVRFPEDGLVSFEAVRGTTLRGYEVEVIPKDVEENVRSLWNFIWKYS